MYLCFHPKQSDAKLLLALGNHLQRALLARPVLRSLLESETVEFFFANWANQ